MSSMFESPCTNHKNGTCPLDIASLRSAIKNGSSDPKAWDRYQAADAQLRKLTAEKAPEPALKAAKADYDKASRAYYDSCAESSAEGKTLLYTIRAHHRGRLHGTKFRLPDGTKVAVTKETQEGLLLTPKAQRLIAKFLKKRDAQPEPSVG